MCGRKNRSPTRSSVNEGKPHGPDLGIGSLSTISIQKRANRVQLSFRACDSIVALELVSVRQVVSNRKPSAECISLPLFQQAVMRAIASPANWVCPVNEFDHLFVDFSELLLGNILSIVGIYTGFATRLTVPGL